MLFHPFKDLNIRKFLSLPNGSLDLTLGILFHQMDDWTQWPVMFLPTQIFSYFNGPSPYWSGCRAAVSKVWSEDFLVSSRSFQGFHKVKTIFLIMLKCYFPFFFLFSHKYTLVFFRGYRCVMLQHTICRYRNR